MADVKTVPGLFPSRACRALYINDRGEIAGLGVPPGVLVYDASTLEQALLLAAAARLSLLKKTRLARYLSPRRHLQLRFNVTQITDANSIAGDDRSTVTHSRRQQSRQKSFCCGGSHLLTGFAAGLPVLSKKLIQFNQKLSEFLRVAFLMSLPTKLFQPFVAVSVAWAKMYHAVI